jgi:hypothetical protein
MPGPDLRRPQPREVIDRYVGQRVPVHGRREGDRRREGEAVRQQVLVPEHERLPHEAKPRVDVREVPPREVAGQPVEEPLGRPPLQRDLHRVAGPGANHHAVRLVQREQGGDRRHRIGAVRVGDQDPVVTGELDAELERRPVASVAPMSQDPHTLGRGSFACRIVGTVIDDEDLEFPARALQHRTHRTDL